MDKTTLTLISVILGWFLGSGTKYISEILFNLRLKESLLEELSDIKDELERTCIIYKRKLQLHSIQGFEPTIPLEINNYFFTHHYKDIFTNLNKEQRLSYQLIHTHITSLNKGFDELTKVTSSSFKLIKDKIEKNENTTNHKYGDYISAQYKNTKNTLWHVNYHIQNSKKPAISLFKTAHSKFISFQEELDMEIKNILSNEQNLTKADF